MIKSIYFSLIVLLAGIHPSAQADQPPIELQFLQALEQREYADAHALFAEAVAVQISQTQLQQIWETLPTQIGDYLGHAPARIEESETGRLAIFRLDFANTDLDARINVNQAGEIDGFWLVPAAEPLETTEALSERAFSVAGDLPGLLTLPNSNAEGPFPVVILVHGSGPGDRDQTLGPNKPFRDLAHGLAEQGIASLRYDKRTMVQPQAFTGAFTVEQEVLADVYSAVDALHTHDEIDASRIYVAGLSLGGMLAPRIGRQRSDLAGLILLAAPARGLEVLAAQQFRYIFGLDGEISEQEAAQLAQIDALAAAVAGYDDPDSAEPGLLGVPQSYLLDLRDYDPVATAKSLDLPMLILQGGRDYQVTVEDDFARWQQTFADSEDVELKQYPDLNHIFMVGEGMATPEEYMRDSGSFSPEVIADIVRWIQQ